MPKTLKTLIPDIQRVFEHHHEFAEGNIRAFGEKLARVMTTRINQVRSKAAMRMSNAGERCLRKLWYEVNKPELAEPLPFAVRVKFLYGDILEELILFLAKEAGHKVEGEQTEIDLAGVKGHRDAVIDGVQVDVKSASSYSFQKFERGLTPAEDAFGYLIQQELYLEGSQDDPLVTEKDLYAFLAIDKQLGHLALDVHRRQKESYIPMLEARKEILKSADVPPKGFQDEEHGKSGNRRLCTKCSYCPFKKTCWPGLRTFLYARSPVHLTAVNRQPDVLELGAA
jgi:hypothetical protein